FVAGEERTLLIEFSEYGARSECARSTRERDVTDQRAQQRRLASAVPADDRDALAPADVEIQRSEPERAALDDGAAQPRHEVAPARARLEGQLQSPRTPRLVHFCEPLEPLLGLADLRAQRIRAAAVGAAGLLAESGAWTRLVLPRVAQR